MGRGVLRRALPTAAASLVAFGVGLAAGHGGGAPPSAPNGAATPALSGDDVVVLEPAEAVGGSPGTRFGRDADGATGAALAYTEAAETAFALPPGEAAELQRRVAARVEAPRLVEAMRASRAELDARYPAGGLAYRLAPLATRTTGATADRATVAVWYAVVFSAPARPAVSDWRTVIYELVWEDGWKVAAEADAPGPRPGPAATGPAPAADLEAELAGFTPAGGLRG